MSDESALIVSREGALLRLTLNRPARGNAMNLAMCQALLRACIDCDEDPGIRCVLLTGSGRLFCACDGRTLFCLAARDGTILNQAPLAER